jgi:hypothetical protein
LLYGTLKSFIRTPNVEGVNYWLPIESEKLKEMCQLNFQEMFYTTRVENFSFETIEALIKQNQVFSYNSIKDPFSGGY